MEAESAWRRRGRVSDHQSPLVLTVSAAGGLRLFCCFFIVTLLTSWAVLSSAGSIGYDHRALLIDGQRRFLISGSIHYPRSTPQMWPNLLTLAKEGGLDVIDTYVFWNGHEPVKGQYNFEDRYDLLGFLRAVQRTGLLVTLRIGPYICAEWDFGGFPNWLLEIPGIEFRTDNEPFKAEMERFVRFIVTMVRENHMFYTQGGPIILAQIENEYRHVAKWYGDAGTRYTDWAANMAIGLNTGVPWIMCSQTDAPESIIITCNGFYCDDFRPTDYNKPKLWTENYPGWFQYWGQPQVRRPVEDVAFAAARFFQKGGSLMNYYMYHGGTNFERTAGARITTSYDYFAPIDEFGQVRYPDWPHLTHLHKAIKLCAPAMAAVDDGPLQLSAPGRYLEIHVYNSTTTKENPDGSYSSSSLCAAFLTNTDSITDANIEFHGHSYHVPAWSVSILPDCKNVLFNTATVTAQTSTKKLVPILQKTRPTSTQNTYSNLEEGGDGFEWKWFQEPVGVRRSGKKIITANTTLEQFGVTRDSTDYLWYSTTFNICHTCQQSPLGLRIRRAQELLHVFINGKKVADHSSLDRNSSGVYQHFHPLQGTNTIDLLSVTLGHPHSGARIEARIGGVSGSVTMEGLSSLHGHHHLDLTHHPWKHQVGLMGEHLHLELKDETANGDPWFSRKPPVDQPLVWYKTTVDLGYGYSGPVALDLGSMKKGSAWINGHHLGRYWPAQIDPSDAECSQGCDYRGHFRADSGQKCGVNCGKPSQRWYHVPPDWLKPFRNRLVLFEEVGGNPHEISFSRPVVDFVCSHIFASHHPTPSNPQVQTNGVYDGVKSAETRPESVPQLNLDCGLGSAIVAINFASFGNPTGTCGNFSRGMCHAQQSEEVVKGVCIGHRHCRFRVYRRAVNGEDPCPSVPNLSLAVEAQCSQFSAMTR